MQSLQKGNKNKNSIKVIKKIGNKKKKLESKEEVPVSDNNIDELVVDSEADRFLVLFEKIFNEKHIEQVNFTQDLDAEDGAIQDILIRIANKISEKIEKSTGENKTLKLL